MRRVVVLISLVLLAACGSQGGDTTQASVMAEQAGRGPAEEIATRDSDEPVMTEDYDDGSYVEEEGSGEFGEPMDGGDADLAAASAPMDDAQGIDPHTETGAEEYSNDY